jgi:hypothetical protein
VYRWMTDSTAMGVAHPAEMLDYFDGEPADDD